jgi:heat shock protein HslJ
MTEQPDTHLRPHVEQCCQQDGRHALHSASSGDRHGYVLDLEWRGEPAGVGQAAREAVIRFVRPARCPDRGVRYLMEVDGRPLTRRLADLDELSVVANADRRLGFRQRCPVAAHNARRGVIRHQGMQQLLERIVGHSIVGVLVLALTVPLAACASQPEPGGSPGTAATPMHLGGIVGYRWQITAVQHDTATVTIPAGRGGYLALTTDGHLGGYDGINPYFGTFTPTGHGYRVTEMAAGAVGGAGRPDPATEALIDGVRALIEPGTDIAASISGDRLNLTVGGYHVAAIRLAPEPNPATPTPTNTPS